MNMLTLTKFTREEVLSSVSKHMPCAGSNSRCARYNATEKTSMMSIGGPVFDLCAFGIFKFLYRTENKVKGMKGDILKIYRAIPAFYRATIIPMVRWNFISAGFRLHPNSLFVLLTVIPLFGSYQWRRGLYALRRTQSTNISMHSRNCCL
jgi:hypothetical protein